jgi:pyruvate-formate lyase-activating enzyme
VKLAHFSEQLMTEVLISVVLDMEEGDVIAIEGGRIDIWDYYLDELKKVLKKSWNRTISRGAKYWTPAKRAELLKLYEAAFADLRDWWQRHHKARTSPRPSADDWKRAEESNPHLITFLKGLVHSKPHELALEYVSQVLGLRGEHGLKKQLTLARKEREAAARKK